MKSKEQLTCVISGSFKFKPEIDQVYDEFQDNEVKVLAPDKGWLYVAHHRLARLKELGNLRPLPAEQNMPSAEIEREFLRQMNKAKFVYLMNPENYMGLSVAFETGYALAGNKPIYAREPLNKERMMLTQDWEKPEYIDLLINYVKIVPISEIEEDFHRNLSV